MKIVYNIYVAVRKLWNAIFGKNGDGSQLVIPGRISGASGDVTVGEGLNLASDVLKSTVPVVNANPETAESDPELTGLMIGSNKYKVPSGGGTKYLHSITIDATAQVVGIMCIQIISESSQPYTISSLREYFVNNVGLSIYVVASGFLNTSTNHILGFGFDNDETHISYKYSSTSGIKTSWFTTASVDDTVIAI